MLHGGTFILHDQHITLPKGSNVVPFWVCYGFGVKDYNMLPKKELHWSPWVNPKP